MVVASEIREGELAVETPPTRDAGLVFIGRIRTPWTSRLMTPRQGRHDGPVCRLEIFEPWVPAIMSTRRACQSPMKSFMCAPASDERHRQSFPPQPR